MSSELSPHLLFCAFAEVPGPSAAGTRTHQLISAFSDEFEVDALSLKGPELHHIQRVGSARMMRVPVEGKPFTERLAAYQRALTRQLSSDSYQLVYCADIFSAQVVSAFRESQGFALLVEVSDLPSVSFAQRYPVRADDKRLKGQWKEAERQAFRGATRVIAPSRHAARLLGERVDPRFLHLMPRAVDRGVFTPPSVELSLDERRTVLVVGGREGALELAATLPLLAALHEALPKERVRLALAGAVTEDDAAIAERLATAGLRERVELVDVDSPVRLANALSDADVVVVPTAAELGVEPFGTPYRALEAMACRRAVVVTGPEAPLADMLVPGEEALVVPAKQPAAVVAAVQRLLDSPAEREAMAQAAARRVEQQADLTTRMAGFAELITEHLGVTMRPKAPETTTADASGGAPRAVSLPSAEPVERAPGFARAAPPSSDGDAAMDDLLSEEAGAFFEDAFDPVPTDIEERPDDSSLLFSDEGGPDLAPEPPPPPRAVDVRAAGGSQPSTEALQEAPTKVGDAPAGLAAALRTVPRAVSLEETSSVGSSSDEWFGDTRIDGAAADGMGPGDIPGTDVITPEPATSSESRPIVRAGLPEPALTSPPPMRALAADDASVAGGDPWAADTIADASPFDDGKKSSEDTERSGRVAAARSQSAKSAPGSLLVDPERRPSPDMTLEDAPAVQERTSSEG